MYPPSLRIRLHMELHRQGANPEPQLITPNKNTIIITNTETGRVITTYPAKVEATSMDKNSRDRILNYIRLTLSEVPASVASLGRIVNDLESAFATLGEHDTIWGRRFQENWAALEETYAFELDRGLDELDDDSSRIISEAIARLRSVIRDAPA